MSSGGVSDKDQSKSRHGGARTGAGRPRKYDFWTMVKIGQDCEELWRDESNVALEARLAGLPHADKIAALQEAAQMIPVPSVRRGVRAKITRITPVI